MATIIRVGGVPVSDYEPTKITSLSHDSGTYNYTLTAPSDGTYVMMVGFSAYAGGGGVTLGEGVTEIMRYSWKSKYDSNGGITVIAKMTAGQTATLVTAGQNRDGGNTVVCYEIWRLSD